MDVWSHDRADHLERLKRLDGMKAKSKATGGVGKVMGNLRFPLDKTYHGCPYFSPVAWQCIPAQQEPLIKSAVPFLLIDS